MKWKLGEKSKININPLSFFMGIVGIAILLRLLIIYGIPLNNGIVLALALLGLYIIGRKINRKNIVDAIEWIGIIGFLWTALVVAFFILMLFLYVYHAGFTAITEWKFVNWF